MQVLVLDFFWHRRGPWGGYSWDRKDFPDPEGFVESLKNGSNAYAHALKLTLNQHPDQAVISRATEDRY